MALLIKKDLNILGDVPIKEIYIRIFFTLDFNGKKVNITLEKYLSKDAYINSKSNKIYIKGIPEHLIINYNREKDGSDILLVIHNKIKDLLSTDKTHLVADIDPSTGEANIDPSTNEIVMIQKVIEQKFTDSKNILIVDIK